MGITRVTKKLVPALWDIDAAIIMCNAYDPQLSTLAIFYSAVEDLSHFTVLNKTDMVDGNRILELNKSLPGEVISASLVKGRGVDEVKYRLNQWEKGIKCCVLGVFNSGKTSLINALTGESNPVDDIPGTTLELSYHNYNGITLIDSVGQLIDVNRPLMVSMDFTGCETIEEKILHCFDSSIEALSETKKIILEPVMKAVDMVIDCVGKGGKLVTVGAGASALVAKEMAGQAQETGLPVMVFTNDFGSAQPISFAKGAFEDEYSLADYFGRAVNEKDCVLGVSASGGTGFVFELLEIARNKGAKTIAVTENSDTPLGKNADIIIKSDGKPEGASSSRVQVAHLVIGYSLILTIAEKRGVNAEQSINYMMRQITRNKKMGIK